MKTIIVLTVAFFICSIYLRPQDNVEFSYENFRNGKDLKRVYTKYVKKGDKFYYNFDRGYLVAIEYYLMAYEKHPNSALLNYKIANCYLHTLHKFKALPYALKALQLNPTVTFDINYVVGQAYQQMVEFDKAIEHYNKFKSTYSRNNDTMLFVNKRIKECNYGIGLVKDTVYEVANMGPQINSEYAEYVSLIMTNKSYMIITSRRPHYKPDTTNTKKRIKGEKLSGYDFDYYEDIFKTDYNRSDSTWTYPYRLNYSSGTGFGGHQASVNVAFDGLTIFTYKGKNGGDLFSATIENGKWTKNEPLKGINSKYREDHVALSLDNQTAYFVSDRPGGLGGKDIWMTTKINDADWGEPINLGAPVNSEYNEDGVFIHPDGKTLYFSSKGHNTMGGYDVFETTFEDNKWTTPVNLGSRVNSPDDDVFFILTADGKSAYFSSVKQGGYGMQDIYSIIPFVKKKKKPTNVVADSNVVVDMNIVGDSNVVVGILEFNPNIVDKDTKLKLNAKIVITDNLTGVKIFSGYMDGEKGYSTSLLPQNYKINVTIDGYLTYVDSIDLRKKEGIIKYNKTIEMEKVTIGTVLVLNHLLLEYRKWHLNEAAKKELDKVIEFFSNNPNIKFQIEGHTDNLGFASDNQILSQKRADAVKNYLVLKGIAPNRIVNVIGYGESKPIDTNNTEAGRQNNRRVDIVIVE